MITQRLRGLPALPGNLSWVSRTHLGSSTTTYNSSSKVIRYLWPLWATAFTCTYLDRHTEAHNLNCFNRLGRWHSSQECLLILKKAQVWFPASTWWGLTTTQLQLQGTQRPSLTSAGTAAHGTDTCPWHTHIHIK